MNNDDFDPDNSSKMTFVWPFLTIMTLSHIEFRPDTFKY